MNDLFIHTRYGKKSVSRKYFQSFERDHVYLPNNSLGEFCLSNNKVCRSIFRNNLSDEYEYDVDQKNVNSIYTYKTRYSRQNEYNIKIDEYTLKRRNVSCCKLIDSFHSDNDKDCSSSTKGSYAREKLETYTQKRSYIENDVYEKQSKNILLENAWECISNGENKRKIHIDEPFFSPWLTDPLHILNCDKIEKRKICKEPYRILSAPKLADDFYLNLLDWSKRNIIAVGLNDKVCIWNNDTCKNDELFVLNNMSREKKNKKKKKKKKKIEKSVTSLKWNMWGNFLAVGLSNGVVEIWDIEKGIKIRKYKNHKLRVGTLCWYYGTLTSGSRDTTIISCDIRSKENSYTQLTQHKSEICGLQWNFNGKQLASGSNDNSIYIWEKYTNNSLFHFTKHKAAVKAISWCPHKSNLLSSGGGSTDKKIFFWNTDNGKCINKINTNSQVSNILWSKNSHEFISTHSYSNSQIIIWNYPELKKITALTGHKLRVLYASLSPDGTSIVSGSPDETIRFWNVFPKSNNYNFDLLFPLTNCYEMIR
ncbi:cell division cycle protein 20 homolog, putative [Plasmodium ovale]|uniref:Cell division cycle protein 20 homolog, putative n=1 Tax=Plasmodium ovale TaxID=36330 RepID=A0A1D3TG13_PLAOA|nr:cell division cycle protein 20 homolog, putative [Plasmodium ovale]